MVRITQLVAILLAFGCPTVSSWAESDPHMVRNLKIYFEEGRFAGWPANNGIWSWGDEIVVGFTLGYYKDKGGGHPIDGDRPSGPMQARSLDGGETWTIERPSYLNEEGKEPEPRDPVGGIDFRHPDFAMMFRMEGSSKGFSRYYYSWRVRSSPIALGRVS